jgi:uncharacterized protein (DUF4415 family)
MNPEQHESSATEEPKNRRGRPSHARPIKQMVSMRMDLDVLEGLRATGKGWQTRVNAAMREWLERGGK